MACVPAAAGTSQEQLRAALHQRLRSQSQEEMQRGEPRGPSQGLRDNAGPDVCPGRKEGGEEFQALTPASSALSACRGKCRTSHHSPCVLQPCTAAHGPRASGQPLDPWPMSAIITYCWPRPPGPAEEGGSKGWRPGKRVGGRRERAELASHFPSSPLPPLQPLGSAEIKGALDFLCLTLWWSGGVSFDSEAQ